MPTVSEFLADDQGKRFVDVVKDRRVNFAQVLTFFDDPARRQRMEDAGRINGQPALAGVVGELEQLPDVDQFFRGQDAHQTRRFRQAVGVVVRMVMEDLGWSPTGQKGYLGKRAKVPAGTTTPGAYYNVSGPSRWFNRAEHYRPKLTRGRADTEGPGEGLPESRVDRRGRLRPMNEDERRSYGERLRKGFDALDRIGTEAERRETLDHLMASLAATRRAEGRPF